MHMHVLLILSLLWTLASCSTPGPQKPDSANGGAAAAPAGAVQMVATAVADEPQQNTLQEALATENALAEGMGKDKQASERYAAAIAAMRAGNNEQAQSLFMAMTEDFPQYSGPHVNLGIVYFRAKDSARARAAFSKALQLNPDSAVSYNHLGILSRLDGDFNQALEYYTNALAIDHNYANAHLNMGILLELYLGQLQPALGHYKRYFSLTGEKDGEVYGWIVDLDRRLSRK